VCPSQLISAQSAAPAAVAREVHKQGRVSMLEWFLSRGGGVDF